MQSKQVIDKTMRETFKVGDKVQRNKAWFEKYPNFPQVE